MSLVRWKKLSDSGIGTTPPNRVRFDQFKIHGVTFADLFVKLDERRQQIGTNDVKQGMDILQPVDDWRSSNRNRSMKVASQILDRLRSICIGVLELVSLVNGQNAKT